MYKSLLTIIAVFFLTLAACGTSEQPSQAVQGSSGDSGSDTSSDQSEKDVDVILETLEMDATVEQANGTVSFQMQLTNAGEETVTLSFASGQQYEIIVSNDVGEKVYQFSEGRSFTEAIVEKDLAAGETLEWIEEWTNPDLEPGTYTVELSLLPMQVNHQVIDNNPFQVERTLDIGTETLTQAVEDSGELFKNIEVTGEDGTYKITGEANPKSGEFYYNVEDGHMMLVEETKVEAKSEGWAPFEIQITIDKDKLPTNGTLTLVMYEKNLEDGAPLFSNYVPLDSF